MCPTQQGTWVAGSLLPHPPPWDWRGLLNAGGASQVRTVEAQVARDRAAASPAVSCQVALASLCRPLGCNQAAESPAPLSAHPARFIHSRGSGGPPAPGQALRFGAESGA